MFHRQKIGITKMENRPATEVRWLLAKAADLANFKLVSQLKSKIWGEFI